jgi:hypothetical protein
LKTFLCPSFLADSTITSNPISLFMRDSLSMRAIAYIPLVSANAQVVPQEFVDQPVARIGSPTAIAFTPDGRICDDSGRACGGGHPEFRSRLAFSYGVSERSVLVNAI